MTNETDIPDNKKKEYTTPKLTVHGDVEEITKGDELGEELDAAFSTSMLPTQGRRRRRRKPPDFS